ncbi:MAG TPA: efflux RND transporter permease subunit [Chromatiales bacterium]|nr:efflux RND transporter permease subunit [Chromatiales bacterium]
MHRLIQFALTQRLLILLLVVLTIGIGVRAVLQLPIDAFPDVSPTQVKIVVKSPGMTPEEVESRITAPIEVELLGIPDQAMLRSVSKYALADITLDFAEGVDIYWARQQVAERINAIWGDLPAGVEGGIAPMTTPLGEMFMFTVDGDASLTERRNLLDWVIRPALRTVPGVADVNALGGYVRSFEVIPDPAAMSARGVSFSDLRTAIESNNRNDGAGRMTEGEETLLVRAEGAIRTLDDLRILAVKQTDNVPIRLQDVAEVRVGALTRYGAVTASGEGETVQGLVLGLRGANAREVVANVRGKLEALKPSLPEGVTTTVFYDRGDLVNKAVWTVTKALLEATVLVVILLILFLGNLRAALTVALSLPMAALITFTLMKYTGMTANLMSLGGLAIAIGMLVDAAVVVVENIVTQLSREKKSAGLPRLHLIYRAAREVVTPVTSGILIIIIVFLPLLTLQGLEGKLFSPVALTIIFALSGSLILSLTAIPVFASYLLRNVSHEEPWLPRKLEAIYRPSLRWSLNHTKLIVGVAITALVITGFVFTVVGKTFMPAMDEGDIIVQLEKLPSISLEESAALDQRVQDAVMAAVPEVKRIVARAGSDEIGLDPMGLNETDSFFVLKPQSEWRMKTKAELIDAIRLVMDKLPGIAYGFTQPIDMRVSEMLTGVRGDVALKIFGEDMEQLAEMGEQAAALLRQIPGAEDVFAARNEGVQYLVLKIDQMAAGRYGLDADTIEDILRAQIEGLKMGIVQEGAQRTPLILRGSKTLRSSPEDFHSLPITLPDNKQIPLSAIAHIERTEGPVMIEREQGARYTVVRSNVRDRDLVGFVDEARNAIANNIKLPAGYSVQWGGEFENQQRAAARLSLVVPISLGLIFLLLFFTFGSVRQAVLILSNIPFAMIGGVLALAISGEYLSVPASVGFIALLGIAVLNGIVMVSYYNQLRAQGFSMSELVVEGAARRLRPVLMTASIAAFGLVPLLFASGPGSEIQRPLAIVVIGGLITSTLLTLILLPILYRKFGVKTEAPA